MTGLLGLLVFGVAFWVWGRPLTCGCGGDGHRGVLAQIELLVVMIGLSAVAAFVGFASQSMKVRSGDPAAVCFARCKGHGEHSFRSANMGIVVAEDARSSLNEPLSADASAANAPVAWASC